MNGEEGQCWRKGCKEGDSECVKQEPEKQQRRGNQINIYDSVISLEVARVLSFDDFLICLVCKSKVQPSDDKSGVCTSCKVVQKINLCKCQMCAKLLLIRPGGDYLVTT